MIPVDRTLDVAPHVDLTPADGHVPSIHAAAHPWKSATTLYIARAVASVARGRPIAVLDLGCGDGRAISLLHQYGYAMHGVELPDRADVLRENLQPLFGEQFESRIKFVTDERRIPFDSAQFDLVYANQVFEHVRFLDQMLAECARVLRPDGTLIALFPTATYPIEGHVLVPFAHWIPSGRFRRAYLRLCLSLGIGRRMPGLSVKESAREWDERLRLYTFYRFMNEIEDLFRFHFQEFSIDTADYIRAKADLLCASRSVAKRGFGHLLRAVDSRLTTTLVTHGFSGVFRARRPVPADRHHAVVAWRH
jgi:SAM-dependent methyltransferase